MTNIPKDLDQKMWDLAENPDGNAIEMFSSTFPEYSSELNKRVVMVRGFKSAKKPDTPRVVVPQFQARPIPAPAWQKPFYASLAFCVLAVISYGVVTINKKPTLTPEPPISVKGPVVSVVPGSTPGPVIPFQVPESRSNVITQPNDVPPVTPTTQSVLDRLVTIKSDRIRLEKIFEMLGEAANVKFLVAPGLQNPELKINFAGQSLRTILDRMGPSLGFTAFDQGDGTVLVIPAIDPKAAGHELPTNEVTPPPALDDTAGSGKGPEKADGMSGG